MKKIIRLGQGLKAKIIIMLIAISMFSVMFAGISSYVISNNILKSKLEKTSNQTIQEISRGLSSIFENVPINTKH